MPDAYNGFRIWNLEFQAMSSSQEGVVIETDPETGNPTGRLSIPSTGAKFWDYSDSGLERHLEDFLKPMWDTSWTYFNDKGWSLDDSVYSRLYSIVQDNDSAYSGFISRNSNIYEPTHNPTGSKTIKLNPSSYIRVMCFIHTSGYRALIGLSFFGVDTAQYYTSLTNNIEPGFLNRYLYAAPPIYNNTDYASTYNGGIGGMFISMIPPLNNSTTPSDTWHLEYSTLDDRFYSNTMSKIVSQIQWKYRNYSNGSSWLKVGTSTNPSASTNTAGVLVGTNMKLSLMLDSKANIGISYKYTATSNTTYLNPIIFVGPFYKKKLWSTDTLCTRHIGILMAGIRGISTTSSSAYHNAAWKGDGNNYIAGDSNYWQWVGSFYTDAHSMGSYSIFTAYPACDSGTYTNYRYAKAGYTTMGLIDEEVFRWSGTDGLVKGQTYNDGQWCYLGNDMVPYAQNGTTGSYYLYPSIRWDGNANGTKTFA